MSSKFTFVDLFCGAGGASIGFERAGFQLALATDIDSQALETFRRNLNAAHPNTLPNSIIHADISELYKFLGTASVEETASPQHIIEPKKAKEIKKKAPDLSENEDVKTTLRNLVECDVVIGGPPCQGFSLIGRSKRGTAEERAKGFIDDPRNSLFKYFLKFVEKLGPKLVLIENVKGLSSSQSYETAIRESLEITGGGYKVVQIVLKASDFDVPQNRERIFFIGIRHDICEKTGIYPSDIAIALSKRSAERPFTLWDAIGDLPELNPNPKPNNYASSSELPRLDPFYFGEEESVAPYDDMLRSKIPTFDADIRNERQLTLLEVEDYKTDPRCSEYRSLINKRRDGDELRPIKLFNHKARYNNDRDLEIYRRLIPGKYLTDSDHSDLLKDIPYGVKIKDGETSLNGFADKYFKLDPNKPSKTIVAHLETDGNAFVHPGPNPRSITPREAARIQSFPDWYRFTGSLRQQYRQIGNAVPPLLAFAIAKEFMELLGRLSAQDK